MRSKTWLNMATRTETTEQITKINKGKIFTDKKLDSDTEKLAKLTIAPKKKFLLSKQSILTRNRKTILLHRQSRRAANSVKPR